ncbi:hypothetical protein B0H19DRAFT_942055, partial [Mycena capillaripes]
RRILRNLLGDPVPRARDYLRHNARRLQSITNTGVAVQENFTQLMILQATGARDLVDIVEYPEAWNFFHGTRNSIQPTESYPCDLDTTSLALIIMDRDERVVQSVMDEMLKYVDSDGIILVRIPTRYRMPDEPLGGAGWLHRMFSNVLHVFYKFRRQSEVQLTRQWVSDVLRNRAYLDGTRYYETAEFFLYFLVHLLLSTHDTALHDELGPLLREHLSERIGIAGDALQLAMGIVACNAIDLPDDVDRRMLLTLQCEDGGFEIGWMYKIPSSGWVVIMFE